MAYESMPWQVPAHDDPHYQRLLHQARRHVDAMRGELIEKWGAAPIAWAMIDLALEQPWPHWGAKQIAEHARRLIDDFEKRATKEERKDNDRG